MSVPSITLYDWAKNTSSPSSSNTLRKVETAISMLGSIEIRTTVEYGKEGSVWVASSQTRREYTNYIWGQVLTSRVEGYGYANSRMTLFTYYSAPGDGNGNYKQLKQVYRPNGGHTRYVYYNDFAKLGLVHEVYEPFEDTNEAKKTVTTYTDTGTGGRQLPLEIQTTISGNAYGKTKYTYNMSILDEEPVRETTIKEYSDSTAFLTTFRHNAAEYASDDQRGAPYYVGRPDGTATSWAHEFNFVTGQLEHYAFHGYAAAPAGYSSSLLSSYTYAGSYSLVLTDIYVVPNQSTFTVSGRYQNGLLVQERTAICTTGTSFEKLGASVYSYDSQSRLTQIKQLESGTSNGNILYQATYQDGLLKTSTNEAGKQQEFSRDIMGRTVTILEEGSVATTVGSAGYDTPLIPDREIQIGYDGSNREIARAISEVPSGSGAEAIQSDFEYDMAGRLISKTMDCCETVTYQYPAGDQMKTINADGGYVLENYYSDGTLYSRTGDGAPSQYVRSAIITIDSSLNKLAVQTAASPFASVGTTTGVNAWSISWHDWLGRLSWLQEPTFNGAAQRSTVNEYNAKGQLAARYIRRNYLNSDLLAPYKYVYNSLGQLSHEGYDVTGGGITEGSSADRLVKRTSEFSKIGGHWWAVSKSYAFPTSSSSAAVKTGETRTRLTHVAGELGSSVAIDANDNVTTHWTKVNRSYGIVANESQFDPKSTPAAFSKSVSVTKLGLPVIGKSPSGTEITYDYDNLWRLEEQHGRDDVRKVYEYYSGSRKTRFVKEGDPLVTLVEYIYTDGRVSQTLRKNNAVAGGDEVTNFKYTKMGNVEYTWGNGTDPMKLVYDAYGRQQEQYQYRDDIASYGDFANPAKKYSKVGWTYDNYTGHLKSKSHYDGSTPRTEYYEYNKLAMISRRTTARGVYTDYGYSLGTVNSTGDLLTENHSDTTTDVTYNSYDRLGRLTAVTDVTGQRSFSYSALGGLALSQENLSDSFYGSGKNFDFYYQGTATGEVNGRFKNYAYNGATWKQSYEASNGRVDVVTATGPGFSKTFDYQYDSDSDHVERMDGGSYDHIRFWEDARELPLVFAMQWNDVSRASYLVPAGGRTTQGQVKQQMLYDTGAGTLNKNLAGAGGGHIYYNMTYDRQGQLKTWDTTLTGGTEASYTWDKAGNPTNYDGQGYSINSLNQIEPTASGTQYSYDTDGNLTGDGTWSYEYDANNRLTRMLKWNGALEFKYDYAGRRVEKRVWYNSPGIGSPDVHLKFAYQGMELVAELDSSGGLRKTFHWGLDLSDTRGGAGGAMGLVMWRDYTTSQSYYPSYDLNGNITGLLDNSGNYVAWYEYDGFGKIQAEGGSMKDANPMRFSTQYTDDETGLVYYGFRYYDPSKGRFINRDPIGEAGGTNLYKFVGNNPISNVDVWGLATCTAYRQLSTNDEVWDDDERLIQGTNFTWVPFEVECGNGRGVLSTTETVNGIIYELADGTVSAQRFDGAFMTISIDGSISVGQLDADGGGTIRGLGNVSDYSGGQENGFSDYFTAGLWEGSMENAARSQSSGAYTFDRAAAESSARFHANYAAESGPKKYTDGDSANAYFNGGGYAKDRFDAHVQQGKFVLATGFAALTIVSTPVSGAALYGGGLTAGGEAFAAVAFTKGSVDLVLMTGQAVDFTANGNTNLPGSVTEAFGRMAGLEDEATWANWSIDAAFTVLSK